MTQSHEIHRHSDGSIDFDFYRSQAIAMRAYATKDAFKLKATFNFTLVMLGLIATATIVAAAPSHWV